MPPGDVNVTEAGQGLPMLSAVKKIGGLVGRNAQRVSKVIPGARSALQGLQRSDPAFGKEESVQNWKGLLKEARAGHPNNVAFCKALQPGLLPGMDGSQIRFIHHGNPLVGQKLAAMFRAATDPDTLEYLHGMEKKAVDPIPDRTVQLTKGKRRGKTGRGWELSKEIFEKDPKPSGSPAALATTYPSEPEAAAKFPARRPNQTP